MRGRPPNSPFRQMAVGDSMFIPGRTTPSIKGRVHHLKPAMRFRFRQVMLRGERGTRVWRIA